MSRAKKRAPRRSADSPEPARERGSHGALGELVIMLGAFVAAALVAEAAGAENLGTALSFGQIAFALAAVIVLLRR